ncbi:hypothetical protein [Prauserella cavernicola]|uniref:Uncharacterized protein n=1 Tax=Prauserella cavernicola TaxID=2800127 RepID=A0A934V5H8_9PSEU|nr:hypothetical protein [Prauserella cavernicola]MBK1785724.1 hypothetical protein [Prauserella cavernicola]
MAGEVSGEKGLTDVFANAGSAVEDVQKVYGGTSWIDAVNPQAQGGSWTFDKEQIDSVIGQWEDLLEACLQDKVALDTLLAMLPAPSEDEPSSNYVKVLWDGLGSLQEYNDSVQIYIADFIDRLKAAKTGIERTEADNVDPFANVGSSE